MEFFLALYTADRLTLRAAKCWARNFRIRFPATDTTAWHESKEILERLIRQSTGDDVEIVIVPRVPRDIHVDERAFHFSLEEPRHTDVVLLSDGLDSLCGAFQLMEKRAGERVAFVSLVTNSRKAKRIRTVRRALQQRYTGAVAFHNANLYLSRPPSAQERTQRSRTMLAIAAGFTVGAGYGSRTVTVSENGLGILNLPVPGLQMTHHSSQALHPTNGSLWAALAERLLGGGVLAYPNRFRTKAEMCSTLPDFARPLIRSTSSCDRPDRHDASDDCGHCGSCVVRRDALTLSGLSAWDVEYSSRRWQPPTFDPAVVQHYHALMIEQQLRAEDPWQALSRAHPTLRDALRDLDAEQRAHAKFETLQLLRRHVEEVTISVGLPHAG
ncbi:MAG: hypothetical protein WAN59_12740 [Candidatus Baltobacteraceae bacterium]